MFNRRQFLNHRFFFIFIVVFATSIILFGLIIFITRDTTFPPSNSIGNPSSLALSTSSASQYVQNQPEPSTQPPHIELTFSSNPPVALEWQPLSPLPNSNRGLITNGNQSELNIAFTFDVCQTEGDLAGYDAEIVRILSETQTPATFFLGGLWMRDHQAETLELANNPLFELGNHSWSHLDFSAITPEEMNQEILLTQQYMFDLLGYQTNLFRLPYGTYNDTSLNVINENGLYIIQWNVVSGDPDPNIDAVSMTDWVLQQVNPGSIIIMHANGRGWHTAEALPGIIQALRQSGYIFVTISELLDIE
jgi:peptidoglycan/xylan/chitin deacetylase (PgdA/CDA1 family)